MAVDNELKALARQGMLSIEDVSVSDLEELVLQPDTKKYGLGIIGKASMEAMLYTLSNKVNKLDLDNKGNQWLVEQCKDVVSIRDGEVTVDIVGVTTAFGEYFSFYIKDFLSQKADWGNILKGVFNVPNNIRLIMYANKIIRQVNKMDSKYLGDSEEYCLPQKIREGVTEILKSADADDKFFKKMKILGKDEFFKIAIENTSELGMIFEEYAKDAEELKKLMKKQQAYAKKKLGKREGRVS